MRSATTHRVIAACAMLTAAVATPLSAATPREMLGAAAFQATTKAQALSGVTAALAASEAALAANPADREAQLQHALAIGYRGKLMRKSADAKQARREFEALVAADPRNAEAQMALAGWHLEAIADIGPMLAGAVLGAKKADGFAALDRAIALGGNRALFPGYAALIRMKVDPNDSAQAKALAQRAAAAAAPTPVDRIFQQDAARLLTALGAGNAAAASALAAQMLPFGRIAG